LPSETWRGVRKGVGEGEAGMYVAQAHVLDERGVHVHALDGLLEDLDDDAVDGRVLEATLAALG
jgi:hypothetical protein